MRLLQVLNLSVHKRAVVDVQWNLHDGNVIASGASDGSIALIDIRHPHQVIQSMSASEGMACLRCAIINISTAFLFCCNILSQVAPARIVLSPSCQRPWPHGASVGHTHWQNAVILHASERRERGASLPLNLNNKTLNP